LEVQEPFSLKKVLARRRQHAAAPDNGFEMLSETSQSPQGRANGSTSIVPAGGIKRDFDPILESPVNRGKAFIDICFRDFSSSV
jgi:hypothetical protein